MKMGAGKRLRKFFNSEITDEMIWEEIITENNLQNIHQLQTLSTEATAVLIDLERRLELLSLGIKEVSPEVGEELAKYEGEILLLNCIKTLPEKSAKAIAKFKGFKLGFNGLKRIDLGTLRGLVAFKGALILDNVVEIALNVKNKAYAEKVFRHMKTSRLCLNHLPDPSDQLLKALVCCSGELELNSIKKLTTERAKLFLAHKGKGLKLKGLTALSGELVEVFVQYNGYIDISGAKIADDEAIQIFAEQKEDRFLLHPLTKKLVDEQRAKQVFEERKRRKAERLAKKEEEEARKSQVAQKKHAESKDLDLLSEFEEFDQMDIKPVEPLRNVPSLVPEEPRATTDEEDSKKEAQLNFEILSRKNVLTKLLNKGIDNLTPEENRNVAKLRKEINKLKDDIKKTLDLMVEERELGAVVFNSSEDLARYLKESAEEDDEHNALDNIDHMDFFGGTGQSTGDIDMFGDSPSTGGEIDLFGDSKKSSSPPDASSKEVDIFGNASPGPAGNASGESVGTIEGDGFVIQEVKSPSPKREKASGASKKSKTDNLPGSVKQEKEKTARRMLGDNIPVKNVAKYTGLSEEEVKKLKISQKEKIEMAKRLIEDSIPVKNIIKYTGLSEEEVQELM
ncbi:MAG: hypothetical protein GY765_34620, partial [bacterium]|nr:hypothetical protein [bacterium]